MEGRAGKNEPRCIKAQMQNAGNIVSPRQFTPHAASPNFYEYSHVSWSSATV